MSHNVLACEDNLPIAGTLPVCDKCRKVIEYTGDIVRDSSLLHYSVGRRYHFCCAMECQRDIIEWAQEFYTLALERAQQDPKKCARLERLRAMLDKERAKLSEELNSCDTSSK